ncbi:MAG: FtsW/RodA/SpoVE family cell cycle protein [Clostridia bacterium]|nr:FtsW/RodA/SpoVE family cell cycle protein [Clostridia bacterium]
MLRGSIPPTGLPLPFISSGGTVVAVFMVAVGVVMLIVKAGEGAFVME